MLSVLLVCALSSAAHAQPGNVALDVFLEQRVAEELAADGTILSRLGVALDIEIVGDKLLVSLVDPSTRRAVASTKVDTVPPNREAAVAQVTQVASNLAAQLARTASPESAAMTAVVKDMRQERDAREAGEYQFRQEALSFGDQIAIYSNGKTTTVASVTVAYQGEMKRLLSGPEFFTIVERPDLADEYSSRRRYAWIGLLGGTAATTVGLFASYRGFTQYDRDFCFDNSAAVEAQCELREDQNERDYDSNRGLYKTIGVGLMLGGLTGILIGTYYAYNPSPVPSDELYSLASQHNLKLRKKYGLPVTQVGVSPYADDGGGGMVVSGRF